MHRASSTTTITIIINSLNEFGLGTRGSSRCDLLASKLIRLLTKPERKLSWLLPPLSNN